MTTVTILKRGNTIAGFIVRGHSGYAEAGSDIVCSAISALSQTTLLGLEQLLHVEADITVQDGELICMLPQGMTEETRAQARLLLDTMVLGIRAIKEQYGNYIHIRERTVKYDDDGSAAFCT